MKVRKPAKVVATPKRVKLTVSLPLEVDRALRAYAGFHRIELSELVARSVSREIARFRVYDLAEAPDQAAPPAPADATAAA